MLMDSSSGKRSPREASSLYCQIPEPSLTISRRSSGTAAPPRATRTACAMFARCDAFAQLDGIARSCSCVAAPIVLMAASSDAGSIWLAVRFPNSRLNRFLTNGCLLHIVRSAPVIFVPSRLRRCSAGSFCKQRRTDSTGTISPSQDESRQSSLTEGPTASTTALMKCWSRALSGAAPGMAHARVPHTPPISSRFQTTVFARSRRHDLQTAVTQVSRRCCAKCSMMVSSSSVLSTSKAPVPLRSSPPVI
mmetsp:Transcript_36126/g.91535  ORF Transcript_36126/g.91535 Transcript_36126/m.91535 type:complete len:249 (+) Transcript_36126:670-1416(+)